MLYSKSSIHTPFSIRDKMYHLDFVLLFSILGLGVISIFAQFSSSGGSFDYYSKSHAIRFGIFFILFLFVSFTKISFWHSSSFLFFFFYCFFCYLLNFMGYNHKDQEDGLIFM